MARNGFDVVKCDQDFTHQGDNAKSECRGRFCGAGVRGRVWRAAPKCARGPATYSTALPDRGIGSSAFVSGILYRRATCSPSIAIDVLMHAAWRCSQPGFV